MGKSKDVIWNFYDDKCQSDISKSVLRLKCHIENFPALRNIQKKRTFDCIENDETLFLER